MQPPKTIQRELDEETERIIDDWIEQKHIHEIVLNVPDDETEE